MIYNIPIKENNKRSVDCPAFYLGLENIKNNQLKEKEHQPSYLEYRTFHVIWDFSKELRLCRNLSFFGSKHLCKRNFSDNVQPVEYLRFLLFG